MDYVLLSHFISVPCSAPRSFCATKRAERRT